jgi:hypothetical protein
MRAQATSQARTPGLRLLDKKPPHRLHVGSSDRSATDYPRFDYLRPSAIQLRGAT